MKIALAQLNATVGDIAGNANLILDTLNRAPAESWDLVVFPELFLTGYPPEDLLLKPAFVKDNQFALDALAKRVKTCALLVGFVDQVGDQRFNAAAWIEKGKVQAIYHKHHLPNYGVFDEQRYFQPGTKFVTRNYKGFRFGITICEDIWTDPATLKGLKAMKPDVTLNISASPFHAGKTRVRHDVAKKAAQYLGTPLIYTNLIGGQDELVFDGGSFIASPHFSVSAQYPPFETAVFSCLVTKQKKETLVNSTQQNGSPLSGVEEIYEALLLGIRDYVRKNGFQKVALGVSGGIDSALVAALAVAALGRERVIGVTMPSKFNLAETVNDAKQLAANLGTRLIEIEIRELYEAYLKTLASLFQGTQPGLAEENLQARIRGTLLMALSNKFNWLVLTTGNKSEMSTGYCTLYGDTAGGFAVLKDVLKTTVYDLSRFINKKAGKDLIPQSTIDRPLTAELRENQKDEDSLGPYAALDPLIVGYVENNLSLADLSKKASDRDHVKKILRLIDRSEYKRRQAPPGIKITPRSFGRDHRMPITNKYDPAS